MYSRDTHRLMTEQPRLGKKTTETMMHEIQLFARTGRTHLPKNFIVKKLSSKMKLYLDIDLCMKQGKEMLSESEINDFVKY